MISGSRTKYYFPEEVVVLEIEGDRKAFWKDGLKAHGIDHENLYAVRNWFLDPERDYVPKAQGQEVILRLTSSAKMSKSKKNVVDPMHIIAAYGADTARWFVLSDSPPERDVEWTASGAEAAEKHLARVWRMATEMAAEPEARSQESDEGLARVLHKTIHDVTLSIESFGFNAAIAKLYGLTSALGKSGASAAARRQTMRRLAQLMSPMTPHLSEEIWALLGGTGLIANAPWPIADPALLIDDSVTLPIQINGKRRGEITVPRDMGSADIETLVLANPDVIRVLDGAAPKKLIVVPGRIVNVVV